jgi:3-oxoacyl-[acyl-carrier protein] reductase
MFDSVKNKTVIVTGASKGIGKGIARVFAMHQAKVMIVARSEKEGLQAVEEIKSSGGCAAFSKGDVTNREDMNRIAKKTVESFHGIDILCANAGIFPSAKLEEMTETQWDSVVNVNMKGMLFAIQACLPHLKTSKAGRVILTSSITGPITGFPGWSHYGATKAGMLGFMRTAAIELARHKITINAVMPGNIITEGLEDLGDDYLNTMAASIPLKRLGTVEDIGNAMVYFASEEAGYVTGQTIVVDGGQVLPESLEALNA